MNEVRLTTDELFCIIQRLKMQYKSYASTPEQIKYSYEGRGMGGTMDLILKLIAEYIKRKKIEGCAMTEEYVLRL